MRVLVLGLMLAVSGAARAEPPRVVVSIPPIAALVENVMAGVAKPAVLVPPGASLHSFALKPSNAAALNDAGIVFWVGAPLETFLEKPIQALAGKATVVELISAPGVTPLHGRDGGVWGDHDDHDHDHDHDDHDVDGHAFLDPVNAKAMVAAIADALAKHDPPNGPRYRDNAHALSTRIDALDRELAATLAPVKAKPFLVFHDGYQYFEKHYGLNGVGAVTVNPDRPPGAGRVAELRRTIAARGAVCVFAEPQFEPRLVQTLIEGTPARTGVLDPEGASLQPGPELYFETMRGLATSLAACLADR